MSCLQQYPENSEIKCLTKITVSCIVTVRTVTNVITQQRRKMMIEKMNQYDAVIIGFGKGGKTMAGALGRQAKRLP